MPLEIVRNDITKMRADAIVNTANPRPVVGSGCDAGIHKKAGPQLLEARRKIGNIGVGQSVATPAFDLDAKYIFHTVGPIWQDGQHGEAFLLKQCYESALQLALEHQCESIAFPLLATGNYGFPKDLALQIAMNVFSQFLLQHEMQIWLVVFNKDAFALSEKLFCSVESYIDENYIQNTLEEEYSVSSDGSVLAGRVRRRREMELREQLRSEDILEDAVEYSEAPVSKYKRKHDPFDDILSMFKPTAGEEDDLTELLRKTDAGFSETLLKLIDKTGKKDSEIYKKANVGRKLFSKIRNNKDYKPSKTTALAFAVALELDLTATQDLIGRAGFALTHSSKMDIIVEFFIRNKRYNIHEINMTLFDFDQPRLGL